MLLQFHDGCQHTNHRLGCTKVDNAAGGGGVEVGLGGAPPFLSIKVRERRARKLFKFNVAFLMAEYIALRVLSCVYNTSVVIHFIIILAWRVASTFLSVLSRSGPGDTPKIHRVFDSMRCSDWCRHKSPVLSYLTISPLS